MINNYFTLMFFENIGILTNLSVADKLKAIAKKLQPIVNENNIRNESKQSKTTFLSSLHAVAVSLSWLHLCTVL